MNQEQTALIEESWDYVITNTEEAGKIFYDKLFDIAPEVRPLFKEDIDSQADKLISLISFVVGKIDDLESIMKDVEDLGIRHNRYNVEPEHYAKVGEALLATLEKGASDIWTDKHAEAWGIVYNLLSDIMIKAAAKVI